MMRTRTQIIERALLHVGHRELAPNDSPLIRAWLRRCGVMRPAPWCAAFASWCIEERDESPAFDQRRPVAVACAGALRLGRMFPATQDPEPGDLMFFATDAKGAGHIGIVVHAAESDRVLCVEGNQANAVRFAWRQRDQVRFSRTREESWRGDIYPPAAAFSASLLAVTYEGTR